MDLSVLATMLFSLFLIVDPMAAVPIFLVITKQNTKQERRAMIRRASVVAFLVLLFFALIGNALLSYFGIGMGAVRIAGGILLFIIGIEMLYGRLSRTETSEHEEKEATEKEDVSVTPLAIPLLAGPGAITAVMLFSRMDGGGVLVTAAAVAIIMLLSWLILSFSERLYKVLGHLGLKVVGRVMGLLLIFVSAQLVLDGLQVVGLIV